ncbi:MAG: type IX secretion system sortase PorU [Candidatus Marinimicrobia bacterium]|nr:type IX secretion system sortase PorU [Candidatus Neomarinimicrobiota bacterium]
MITLILLLLLQIVPRSAKEAAPANSSGAKPYSVEYLEDGIILTLKPVFRVSRNISGKIHLSFLGESDVSGDAGEPSLPVAVFAIGVPEDATPMISNVGKKGGRFLKGELSRRPNRLKRIDGIPVFELDETGIMPYSELSVKTVRIEDAGYFRQQRIFSVIIAPYDLSKSPTGLYLLNEVTVRIDFGRAVRGGKRTKLIPAEEELYRTAILNFEQSRKWLKEHSASKSLKKGAQSGPGDWYRMTLREDGIYRITDSDLQAFGVNITGTAFNRIKIFSPYFEGRIMNGKTGAEVKPNLKEMPAWRIDDNADGDFDPGDEILFYGKGPSGFEYDTSKAQIRFIQNPYSTVSVYWLNIAPVGEPSGKEMAALPSADATPDAVVTQYQAYLHYEEELINFLRSGTGFFGVSLSGTFESRQLPLTLNNLVKSEPANFKMRVRSGIEDRDFGGRFLLKLDGTTILTTNFVRFFQPTFTQTTIDGNILNPGLNNFTLEFQGVDNPSKGYLDWLEIRYTRELTAESDVLHFFSPINEGIISYTANGFSTNDFNVFNVSNLEETYRIIPSSVTSSSLTWKENLAFGQRSEYFAAAPAEYLAVSDVELVEGFDTPKARIEGLQADYIIITHKDFRESADRLAQYRTSETEPDDRLKTLVFDVDDVIKEFSAGQTDPMAFRYFIKYAYENWSEPKPFYVLLFGDGDYDYRNITGESTNFIMTYQLVDDTTTLNGKHISFISSRAADDHFIYISGNDNKPDLSIGRIVSRTPEDAENFVEKLILYESQPIFGNWKNTITIVADDLFRPSSRREGFHINDSENIIVPTLPINGDIRKIYLTEYKVETDAAVFGVRKPDATKALLDQLNRGTTFLIYIGHGGPTVLAQEKLLASDRDLNIIDTGMKLPIWVAGTCEFGRYDDPNIQSMAEDLLVQKQNGAIGMFAASRLVFSGANATITASFFNNLLPSQPYTSNVPRVGAALLATKLTRQGADPSNDQKYHFLGDPAMRVALPRGRAIVEEIDPSVLMALGKTTLKGKVQNEAGTIYISNSTSVSVNIFDSDKSVTRSETYNGVTGSISYVLPGSRIFSGPVSAESGNYESTFIVPRDISYGGNSGKALIYWWDESAKIDGTGAMHSVEYSGTADSGEDNVGPDITIGFRDIYFRPGDIVPPEALLEVIISDENGINLAEEVGHKITLTIDDNLNDKFNITQFFEYDINSYQKGSLEYPMPALDEGEHSLTVKAWDSFNNFSEETIVFSVVTGDDLSIERVYNYPNPMSNSTDFTFYINQPAELVEIRIYTVAGRLIKKIQDYSANSVGFQRIGWDGRDETGDRIANGVYIYRLRVKSLITNKWAEVIEKLAIAR